MNERERLNGNGQMQGGDINKVLLRMSCYGRPSLVLFGFLYFCCIIFCFLFLVGLVLLNSSTIHDIKSCCHPFLYNNNDYALYIRLLPHFLAGLHGLSDIVLD